MNYHPNPDQRLPDARRWDTALSESTDARSVSPNHRPTFDVSWERVIWIIKAYGFKYALQKLKVNELSEICQDKIRLSRRAIRASHYHWRHLSDYSLLIVVGLRRRWLEYRLPFGRRGEGGWTVATSWAHVGGGASLGVAGVHTKHSHLLGLCGLGVRRRHDRPIRYNHRLSRHDVLSLCLSKTKWIMLEIISGGKIPWHTCPQYGWIVIQSKAKDKRRLNLRSALHGGRATWIWTGSWRACPGLTAPRFSCSACPGYPAPRHRDHQPE